MVGVYQPRDIGGELGGMIGGGLGKGFGEGLEMLAQRNMLNKGIDKVEQDILTKQSSGETVNPISVTLGLMKSLGGIPGGMQAISELAPAMHKEIQRSNLSRPKTEKLTDMPEGSIIEDSVEEVQEETLFDPSKFYEQKYQENLERTGDPDQAAQITTAQLNAQSAEQSRRAQEQSQSTAFLNEKVTQNFPSGVSAPLQNEMEKEYFDLVKTTDKNRAWNQIMPKYRNAQLAEESLKNATASNRPGLFVGDMNKRMDSARVALKPIADIDPEFAASIAMKDLDYGPSEAAKLVRPGSKTFNNLVSQLPISPRLNPKYPLSGNIRKDTEKFLTDTDKKVEQFLKKGWDSKNDSLLALRGELFDKGYPSDRFIEQVHKAFPGKDKDQRLSTFNKNEYNKLGEPVIPGLQELFSEMFSGRFGSKLSEKVEYEIKGKR